MTRNVIEAIGIGKRYRRQVRKNNLPTLRDALSQGWSNLFERKGHGMEFGSGKEDFWAIRNVDFEVKEGEVVGLIGRNGAGKSTLLKILSRICEPTEGNIHIHGRVGSLLEVGTGFHPELTGRENVYLNGAILGLRREEIHRKFDAIVDFSGVESFLDTPVKHYSSGMQARLGFAVAAHLEPEVLIVDEVLAVGDAAFQNKCLGKMQDASKNGRTVIYVSHNMASLGNLCTRGVLLDGGKIVVDATIDEAVSHYLQGIFATDTSKTDFKQRGMSGFNFLDVKILDSKGNGVNVMVLGQDFEINFLFDNKLEKKLHNIRIGLLMTNEVGVNVINVNSKLTGYQVSSLPRAGMVVFKLRKVALAPGRYNITFHLNSSDGIIRQIHNNLGVTVVDGDFYGSGEGGVGKSAIYMPDCELIIR